MQNKIVVKDHLAYFMEGDSAIVWNRFRPSLLRFRKNDLSNLLDHIENNTYETKFDEKFLLFLKKNNIMADENYEKKFSREIDVFIKKKEACIKERIKNELPFPNIHIFNEKCNLHCSYCISKQTWGRFPNKTGEKQGNKTDISENIFAILQQQYHAMKIHNQKSFLLTINGGEPLLFFEQLKEIVDFIRNVRLDEKTKIAMNTNGTMITDEIAKFIAKENIKVVIGIDGNKKHHDTTRIYANKRGSFENVIKNLRMLRKNKIKKTKISFQGTIEDFNLIDQKEIDELSQFGIKGIRMSPNVLTGKNKNGAEIAFNFFNFVKDAAKNSVVIGDEIFLRIKDAINGGIKYAYSPYCNGLGAHDKEIAFSYNFENGYLSYCCQFAPLANIEINGNINIFSQNAVDKTVEFMKDRANKVKEACLDCAIVGFCRGGCVIDGLTAFNEVNRVACDYRKALWLLFVKEEYARKKNQGRSLAAAT